MEGNGDETEKCEECGKGMKSKITLGAMNAYGKEGPVGPKEGRDQEIQADMATAPRGGWLWTGGLDQRPKQDSPGEDNDNDKGTQIEARLDPVERWAPVNVRQ